MVSLSVAAHEALALRAACLVRGPNATVQPGAIARWIDLSAEAPVRVDADLVGSVRKMLRVGGFKPSGRNKPASEYLRQAAERGSLGPILPLVDLGNAVSLHSGIPISVVDLDRAEPPLEIATVREKRAYVFNAAGQELALEGLVCLHDARGPCANAIKDAQRTKVDANTTRALVLLWGARGFESQVDAARAWLSTLATESGFAVSDVQLVPAGSMSSGSEDA